MHEQNDHQTLIKQDQNSVQNSVNFKRYSQKLIMFNRGKNVRLNNWFSFENQIGENFKKGVLKIEPVLMRTMSELKNTNLIEHSANFYIKFVKWFLKYKGEIYL